MAAARIDLAVFDMAGTTIDEGLRVYRVRTDNEGVPPEPDRLALVVQNSRRRLGR
ncbi:hypothetical protein JK364_01205 [Streptomyces sp. 110]|uniref:Haloacid dehalogenase n=1 Tax=Streptomyces endocoffeicus TaxID=2898945 RepID=A0ABS1PF75_9ACTN|nr:hypothetical protein [Streptomyces endocoffeicus]MBL1111036.1 hypothetical protein [Streptomyces endocoffeicus]